MPSTDEMKKRQEARELRKAARDGNIERAHAEAATLSAKSQANELERVAQPRSADVRKEPPRAVSRKEKQAGEKRKAERQADIDLKRSAEPVDIEAEVNKWDGNGQPPLHILNAVAEKIDAGLRDEGKEIAQAAAKGAYDTYVGKIGGGQRNRHARMRAQIAAGQASLAAKKTEA